MKSFGKVSNPLTIIAIFASITEVAGSVVVATNDNPILVWFFVLFPTLLVIGTFWVLIKKKDAFFFPSDFQSDESYLSLFSRTKEISTSELSRIYDELNEVNDPSNLENDIRNLKESVNESLMRIEELTKPRSFVNKATEIKGNKFIEIELQVLIKEALSRLGTANLGELSRMIPSRGVHVIHQNLVNLRNSGLVESIDGGKKWKLNESTD